MNHTHKSRLYMRKTGVLGKGCIFLGLVLYPETTLSVQVERVLTARRYAVRKRDLARIHSGVSLFFFSRIAERIRTSF